MLKAAPDVKAHFMNERRSSEAEDAQPGESSFLVPSAAAAANFISACDMAHLTRAAYSSIKAIFLGSFVPKRCWASAAVAI